MNHVQTFLPAPSAEAQQHSEQLLSRIIDAIEAAGGAISFAEYMQYCLYSPGLGYYSAGLANIGRAGDFVTAPEISPLFSGSLAHHVADVLRQIPNGNCLEFGAGNGTMAIDLLLHLAQLDSLPEHYYILEASADLRHQQQQQVNDRLGSLAEKVIWLDQLPSRFSGAVLANEVCDAMPAHQLIFDAEKIQERCVSWDGQALIWQQQPVTDPIRQQRAAEIAGKIPCHPFISEINLYAEAWLNSLADRLQQGAIFILDYGHSDTHYYQSARRQGSIRCHYRHQVHDDPLVLPGLQDITTHVPFTALAEAAFTQGLTICGYQRQNDFLLAGNIMQLAQQTGNDDFQQLQTAAALKRLLLPEQMGEIFKVLTLSRNLDVLPRLQQGDLRYQL